MRCIRAATDIGGIEVHRFDATPRDDALSEMAKHGLQWTWGTDNVLKHHPYGGPLETRVGCAMSHYRLWLDCAAQEETFLILEHDAVFVRAMPEIEFDGICQVNDPLGATHRGSWWAEQMEGRAEGAYPKTPVRTDPRVPDGLAGNSAYLIKPWAARKLVNKCHEVGLWPNDAIMCIQFFPFLQEYYPFITRVEQTMSTTST